MQGFWEKYNSLNSHQKEKTIFSLEDVEEIAKEFKLDKENLIRALDALLIEKPQWLSEYIEYQEAK
jgi:hypothetical protein